MDIINIFTELFNSIVAYFSGLDFGKVLESVNLVIGNINLDTFTATFDALKVFLAAIFG